MQDWEEFAARIDSLPEEELLSASADELLKRLDGIGQRANNNLESTMHRSLADHRPPRLSIGSDADDHRSLGGSSVTSLSTDGGRLQQKTKIRPPRSRRSSVASSKENVSHVPQISDRSKELIGDRGGDAGSRLHDDGMQRAARRQEKLLAAELSLMEKEAKEAKEAIPEINGVSAMLASGRNGKVGDRLFEHAKESARMKAEKTMESQRQEMEHHRPAVSGGSERIAAVLPGREGPVEDRLYNAGKEQAEKLLQSRLAADAEIAWAPDICETSRRIAERANAGVPLQERLASKTGSCPSRPTPLASELQECYYAPTINQKSERLAAQVHSKSWAQGQVAVEDRLIASIQPKEEEVLPEQKPEINPNSLAILARRGPILPLEERLQQQVRHVRSGVGSELEACTLAPTLSEGSKKLLARRGKREGSVVDRLNAWGKQHQRGEGDASLADRKFQFGAPEEGPPPLPTNNNKPLSERVRPPSAPSSARKSVAFDNDDGASEAGSDVSSLSQRSSTSASTARRQSIANPANKPGVVNIAPSRRRLSAPPAALRRTDSLPRRSTTTTKPPPPPPARPPAVETQP